MKKMNKKLILSTLLVGSILIIVGWIAFGSQNGKIYQGINMSPARDIGTNITSTTTHPTFSTKIKEAGYDKLLQNDGPFTVFLPSEAAYANMTEQTRQYLGKPEHSIDQKAVLLFHVVKGKYALSDLKDGMTLTTVQGEQLRFKVKNGTWLINEYAYITVHDINSQNGVIHVIDNLLIPDSLLVNSAN